MIIMLKIIITIMKVKIINYNYYNCYNNKNLKTMIMIIMKILIIVGVLIKKLYFKFKIFILIVYIIDKINYLTIY